jgi:hypothetical protein
VGLKWGSLSLVRIIEELLERKSSCSGQENRINDRGGSVALTTRHLYPQKLALTLPTSGGRSVGIVRLWTKGHGVLFIFFSLVLMQYSSTRALFGSADSLIFRLKPKQTDPRSSQWFIH